MTAAPDGDGWLDALIDRTPRAHALRADPSDPQPPPPPPAPAPEPPPAPPPATIPAGPRTPTPSGDWLGDALRRRY
jgi:hypothetical protein